MRVSWEDLYEVDWTDSGYPLRARPHYWASSWVYFEDVPIDVIAFGVAKYLDPRSSSDHDTYLDGWYVIEYDHGSRSIVKGPFESEKQAADYMEGPMFRELGYR